MGEPRARSRRLLIGRQVMCPSAHHEEDEDDKFAAYSKTFITRISAVSCALRDQAHHLEVKP